MADPYHHSLSSVKKWGGEVDNYLPVHRWFDQPKGHFSDPRSRAIRHHAQGIDWAIEHFGQTVTLSTCRSCGDTLDDHGPQRGHVFAAKVIPTRWVGEQHVIEDFGRIPTMADFLRCMTVEPWMVRSAIPLSRVL